ncbi:MAG TPA: S1/P1 nuclease [Candidatus Angelobacter sp.]|nr:S1/P1 nuclease [Candidatus Angelobacter sp.]
MRRLRLLLGLVLCMAVFYSSSEAWNSLGHMTVAYVAYQHLHPTTKKRVAQLLKMNPRYHEWLSKIPADTSQARKDMMVFVLAATWPDEIKGDATYKNDGPAGGNRPPDGPTASQNIGYQDHLRHKYWHFVDQPFSQDGTPVTEMPLPNAQTEIALMRKAIASDATDDVKSYDLVWLLHLVGDIHQPLHCATRFTTDEKNGDSGGNTVKICQGKNCKGELHAFWDGLLGTSDDPSAAVIAGKKLAPADATLAGDNNEADWAKESFDLAQSKGYVAPIQDGDGPFTLTVAYRTSAKKIGAQRVALAGARLANLLNDELK